MFGTSAIRLRNIHVPSPLRLMDVLVGWQARHDQRVALSELDDRLLRDIGVDARRARVEAAKPFWRV